MEMNVTGLAVLIHLAMCGYGVVSAVIDLAALMIGGR
jgi:hypothetical protein